METPLPDPAKLLAHWMEWERGEASPGTVLKNLKVGGLPDLLRTLAGDAVDQPLAGGAGA